MDRGDLIELIEEQNVEENLIDVEEQTKKEVDFDSVPLGSQFAVGHIFPQRKGLITGHRIPLGLFPIETQNKILELDIEEEDLPGSQYVEASSFRRSNAPSVELSPPSEKLIKQAAETPMNPPEMDQKSLDKKADVALSPPEQKQRGLRKTSEEELPLPKENNNKNSFKDESNIDLSPPHFHQKGLFDPSKHILSQEGEKDPAYHDSLHIFAPPSFF